MTPDDVLATGLRQLEQRAMSNKFDAAVWAEIKQLRHELEQAGAASIAFEGLAEGLYVQQHTEHVLREEVGQ